MWNTKGILISISEGQPVLSSQEVLCASFGNGQRWERGETRFVWLEKVKQMVFVGRT